MIRYTRHTGPISHPQIDPPEMQCQHCGNLGRYQCDWCCNLIDMPVPQPWEDDTCMYCGRVGESAVCFQCDQDLRDDEGDDP